ncbi:thiamine pyrophosphate-dependent dehydrogenase E1 component subunit alpha [Candidatus Palauibacter sp.]|uniref:thiamine pyrophosphate-dependent dehydrogenase E1 component subunit alpha n=1 Tax=Candidatus Palauibacter sp. TaxID=3101350 RepID=UPI003B5B4E7E
MRRYAAYDPPEYTSWQPDRGLVEEYRERVSADPDREREIVALPPEALLAMYRGLLRFRLSDIALARWVKQGVISKAWLGTGEEAVTVGAVHALDRRGPEGDIVGPMIRNQGANYEMGVPIIELFRTYLATADAPAGGRDLHLGDLRYGVCPPISMVATLSTVMNGFALAFRIRGERRVALTWVGDGATKHGEAHEAFAFAASLKLPIVFIIQNNQVALGTRLDQHHAPPDFSDWGPAYGIPSRSVDGNHVLDVYAATRLAAERCRQGGGPQLIEARTFRMGGHATHDVHEARATFAPELFERWGRRDPIGQYEEYLADIDLGAEGEGEFRERNLALLESVEQEVEAEIEAVAEEALASRYLAVPRAETAASGVYSEAPA